MYQTFNNGFESKGQQGRNLETAETHRDSTLADLEFFAKTAGIDPDELLEWIGDNIDEFSDLDELGEFVEKAREVGAFDTYGLDFSFVDAGTFPDQSEGYYRYQFCWGGPSSELRILENGTVEFVFMDWGTGIGWDVSKEDGVIWLVDMYTDCGSIDWDSLEYEQKHKEEDEDSNEEE